VFVSWRQPAAHNISGVGDVALLWCHDLNYGPLWGGAADMHVWDKVLGVSQWHANYLSRAYGIEADYVPNGINIERFEQYREARRVPMQCVYTSSPDRGLEGLLHLWPRIVEREPGAKLVVAYGFDTIDRMIEQGRGDLAALKHRLMAQMQGTPNVEHVGRLPQDKLAELFSTSYAWLYPTQFTEVSCITAMEAMAGGCVPVTSAVGALQETIGGFGITIPGAPWSRAFGDFYIFSVLGALTQPDVRMPLSLNGPTRAAQLTWDKSAERWFQIVEGLLSPKATEPEKELVLA
jgi:glycosyltransferase involved in cell wall biosynthesis